MTLTRLFTNAPLNSTLTKKVGHVAQKQYNIFLSRVMTPDVSCVGKASHQSSPGKIIPNNVDADERHFRHDIKPSD